MHKRSRLPVYGAIAAVVLAAGLATVPAMAGTGGAVPRPAPTDPSPTPYSPKHKAQRHDSVQPDGAEAAGVRAYFVITAPNDTAGAKTAIANNSGTVYASYDAIGVIVAHSASTGFAAAMRGVTGVQQVGATRTTDVPAEASNPAIPPAPSQSTPTSSETSRYDMVNIGADRAWAVNQGSPDVTVGVLDTGVDDQHYDLRDNFDASKSASCAYGKLDTRAGSWRDTDRHGTHVAGTIAAAKNGKGMVGVAPRVKIASVRIAEKPSGLFFPENTVCAFVFAGDQGFDVTNNSYYTDPWLFNCPSDVDQKAILEGVKRAAAYAEGRGVLNVAAAGNENYNLASKTTDTTSPDDSTPVTRNVTNDCLSLPTELPGVVTVSALTSSNTKSSYSNFGTGKVHIAAPGDSVYSTVPGGTYSQLSGTSMASPHVAGVAALLASVYPNATPAELRGKLATHADDQACPSDSRCTGTAANNSFYGEGRTDAYEAVSGSTPSPTPTGSPTPSPTPTGTPGCTATNGTDVTIPDNTTVESSITISGCTGNASASSTVAVNIAHTYIGDLVVSLVAPDGSAYTLHNRTGSGTDNINQTYPVNLSGEAANGTWKLRVQDAASQDTGKIDSWTLNLGGGTSPSPTPTGNPPCGGTNGTDVAIGDNQTVTSTIAVSGCTGNASTSSTVAVNIRHTYIGDLVVALVAPDGTAYTLHNRTGSGTDNINQTYTVNLSSEVRNGTWTLRVTDAAAQDTGTIDTWTLTL